MDRKALGINWTPPSAVKALQDPVSPPSVVSPPPTPRPPLVLKAPSPTAYSPLNMPHLFQLQSSLHCSFCLKCPSCFSNSYSNQSEVKSSPTAPGWLCGPSQVTHSLAHTVCLACMSAPSPQTGFLKDGTWSFISYLWCPTQDLAHK